MVAVDPKFTFVGSNTKVIFKVSRLLYQDQTVLERYTVFCHQLNENPKSSDSRHMSLQKR